ncbi:hypothetical protein SDC9_163017 [bioreactor metagenome]|uniref:Uncharacterized protein n=1 Tax=bioreactor metagenome TaxID=1076179 RepID=A0A645FUB1_9ZZZZ
MATRDRLAQDYRLPINGDFISFSQISKRNRDVIQRMDLDVLHTFTQALVQFNGEIIARIVEANISDHFTQQLDICRCFTCSNPTANHLAQNTTEVFMARV